MRSLILAIGAVLADAGHESHEWLAIPAT